MLISRHLQNGYHLLIKALFFKLFKSQNPENDGSPELIRVACNCILYMHVEITYTAHAQRTRYTHQIIH